MEIYDRNVVEIMGLPQKVNSLQEIDDLHRKFVQYRWDFYCQSGIETMAHYRSEQYFGWDITPGVFRKRGIGAREGKELEKRAALMFERIVTENFGPDALRDLFYRQRYGKDWDILFQAQHAGVKTTLVDWTARIDKSVYFAVEESMDGALNAADGQLWVYMIPTGELLSHNTLPIKDTFYDQDPADLRSGAMINVSICLDNLGKRLFETRMFKQGGRFYISASNECNIPLNRQQGIARYLFRFRIPAARKKVIREELAADGLTRETVYVQENPEHQALIDAINTEVYG